MKKTTFIIAIFTAFLLTSCIKDLDFNQANDLELEPTLVGSLVNFEIKPTDVVIENTTIEVLSFTQRSTIQLLQKDRVKENLKRVKFDIKITNEYDRKVTIGLKFLNADGSEFQGFDEFKNMEIEPNTTNYEKTDRISLLSTPEFLDVRFVEVSVAMEPSSDGSIIDRSSTSKLTFKSAATLYTRF